MTTAAAAHGLTDLPATIKTAVHPQPNLIEPAKPGERPVAGGGTLAEAAPGPALTPSSPSTVHPAPVLPETAPSEGFGPGAQWSGEPTGSQLQQLSDTITKDLRTGSGKGGPLKRVQRAIEVGRGKMVRAKNSLGQSFNDMRAATVALKDAYVNGPKVNDFREAAKDWLAAVQRTSFETRQFVLKLRGEIKDPLIREGITNYIQAGGDMALLQQRAEASDIRFRPGYETAMRLTPEQQGLAVNIGQYFDSMLQMGIDSGMLTHGVENYINQVWKKENPVTRELTAQLQSGKLQKSFQFAKQRIFSSFFDGEQAGYTPASKDVSSLVAAYDLSFNRALAARAFIKSLREAKAADGEPAAKFSGMTQPVPAGQVPPEANLIKSRAIPDTAVSADGRPYVPVDHPALRGWKYVVQNKDATPAYYQSDMLVHPDHASDLRKMLGTSAFRTGKLGAVTRPLLKIGAYAKQTKLSLSPFHLVQEGLHSIFHRTNPFNLVDINFDDPEQYSLIHGGLQVADYLPRNCLPRVWAAAA